MYDQIDDEFDDRSAPDTDMGGPAPPPMPGMDVPLSMIPGIPPRINAALGFVESCNRITESRVIVASGGMGAEANVKVVRDELHAAQESTFRVACHVISCFFLDTTPGEVKMQDIASLQNGRARDKEVDEEEGQQG